MSSSLIGERYARALLEIGVEKQVVDQLGRELDRVVQLFAIDDVRNLFRNPKFDVAIRKAVLSDLLAELSISPLCRNFLFLLVDRARIGILPSIVAAYHALADHQSDRVRARIRVAQALSDSDIERLRSVIQEGTGKRVVIEQKVDTEIVGGVIANVGGRVYDGSIRTQLETLRTRLKSSRVS
ncbi:MAG: ATP synthase F1 subunit delta [Myxococcota bacterium]|nr:ATP synthase F1 subunit delta [Myxococcota bacterium]